LKITKKKKEKKEKRVFIWGKRDILKHANKKFGWMGYHQLQFEDWVLTRVGSYQAYKD